MLVAPNLPVMLKAVSYLAFFLNRISFLSDCPHHKGVCYAASKLTLSSSLQLSLTLALLAIGIWFLFDRTLHGFIISFTGATIGTIVVLILVRHGVYR
ncbi:hypothetical protein BSLG_004474 [Batrachochytrium salamandrivorans]|nr:hypothetical protein BSLG_004474 [Batrachochytrium salamandrivorans]